MEHSSQEHPTQPSQEELRAGLPEGYPLRREHLHDVDPLPKDLQDILDRVMSDKTVQPPVKTNRRQLGNR